jgi:hypothetical protein
VRSARARRIAALAVIALGCHTPAPPPRPSYVFAWPFLAPSTMEPRGGSTRGTDVVLATEPSEAWQLLQKRGRSAQERDRAAILALAGDYRASFDFLETVLFTPGAQPARPYRSWGTERIYVLENRVDFVSLQHILVMFTVDEKGAVQGPFVQKHWRQAWRYEPASLLVYAGNERFEKRALSRAERRGAWSQTVYDVDDALRYSSLARWVHGREASVWDGGEAWRPLPRREYTVRHDYQVLAGRNRISVLPTGWVHEQDNLKLVLAQVSRSEPKASEDHPVGEKHPLARELGVDRYERIVNFDFSAADAYWRATSPFWKLARDGWAERFARKQRLTIRASCGEEPGFAPFFAMAGRLENGEQIPAADQRKEVERILDCVTS